MSWEKHHEIEKIGSEYFFLWVAMCEISGEKYEVGDASFAFRRYSEEKYGISVMGGDMLGDAMSAKMNEVRKDLDE